jgi:tRNA 2-thiouridine synthesizing protein B
MAILHLVNHSPARSLALEHCLTRAGKSDGVLLIEDAVYAAVRDSAAAAPIRSAAGRVTVYVLGPDLEARGLGGAELAENVRIVDYRGFVRLTAAYSVIQSWF